MTPATTALTTQKWESLKYRGTAIPCAVNPPFPIQINGSLGGLTHPTSTQVYLADRCIKSSAARPDVVGAEARLVSRFYLAPGRISCVGSGPSLGPRTPVKYTGAFTFSSGRCGRALGRRIDRIPAQTCRCAAKVWTGDAPYGSLTRRRRYDRRGEVGSRSALTPRPNRPRPA